MNDKGEVDHYMKLRYLLAMTALTAGLSGFCGLIYLVIWDRILKYYFGGDAVSSILIAAVCLLGLGLGAYVFGRRRRHAFKFLILLELLIGLFGILGFYLITPLADALTVWLQTAPEQAMGLRASVVAGSLLLLPPAALIGGVLPLLTRCFAGLPGLSAPGLIQGFSALGASFGMLALPLLFLNRLSLPATLAICGALNIALALIIWLWSRRLPVVTDSREAVHPAADAPLLHALAFITGFIASAFGSSLLRALPIVNPSSAYNLPLALLFFLFAFALGSLLLARGTLSNRDAVFYKTGWLLAGTGPAMFLGIWIASHLQAAMYPVSLLPLLDGNYANLPWVLLFCVTLIMPTPFLLGAVFPLLLQLRTATPAQAVGGLLLSAFLGACGGLLLGRFAGFPLLGTEGFLSFIYWLACGAGLGLMVRVWRRNLAQADSRFSGALPGGMLALAIMLTLIMPSGIWLTYITGGPEQNWEVREGLSGVAQLWWEEEHADLRVNGEYMSRLPYHPRHIKQEIFLLAQPRREKVLVLGLGSAEIIRSLVEDEAVKSIDVVDRSRELPEILSGGRAAQMLNDALGSPKLRILNGDARVAVGLYEAETFDLVFDNLAFASWAGATAVKSEAYFREIRRILKPRGVFLTGANYAGESRLAVLAGLVNTFEIVKEHRHAEIVIATSGEPQYFDFRIIQLTEPRAAIFGLNYTAPDALPAWFRNEFIPIGREQLLGVEPVRDERPVYEYFWRPF